jgi:signal transduction histidine kinase
MELALEALNIAREIDDPVRQGFALSNVGGILAATGDVEGASERLQEALSLFESVDHAQGIGRICSRLSKLCREHGQLDQALLYARRLRDAAERSGLSDDRATALAALAELELDQGNRGKAERLFRESLEAYEIEEASAVMGAAARVSLGRLMAQRGAFAEAESQLTKALDGIIALDVPCPADEASARQALADLSEQQGDLQQANAHLREVIGLRERAAQDETRNQLAQFEARAQMKAAQQEAEIHRLKFVELSQMQSKLIEAEKMVQLGTLAAGTAHELNSPLGVLRSNLSMYAKVAERLSQLAASDRALYAQTEKLAAALPACQRTSEDALARIAAVAESLKRFTALDLAEKRTFNVVDGLDAAIALLRPILPEQVALESHFEPVPDIAGWPGQLNQAFMTVLLNATQAIDGQGVVTVETSTAADTVVVRVRDTGRGMSEQERAQLFDVGWSADGKRTKMRLGLSAAYAAVQRHSGRVEVESAPGKGTVFVFHFPAHSRSDSVSSGG